MKQIKVLYGFDDRTFEREMTKYLGVQGYDVKSTVKISKTSIHDFLEAHEDYDAAVLLEVGNKSRDERVSKYTAEELAILTDNRNINIVVLLNKGHYATPYMELLYTAGITSAIFQEGRKGGATPRQIVELLLHPRSRREARVYYGLQGAQMDLQILGKGSFEEYKKQLFDINYGETFMERFLTICRQMSKKQILDFIRRLPDELIKEMRQYEEFYMVVEELQKAGAKIDIHRPKGKLNTLDDIEEHEPENFIKQLPHKNNGDSIILERPEPEEKKEPDQIENLDTAVPDFSKFMQMEYEMDQEGSDFQKMNNGQGIQENSWYESFIDQEDEDNKHADQNQFGDMQMQAMVKELESLRKWKELYQENENITESDMEELKVDEGKRVKMHRKKQKGKKEPGKNEKTRKDVTVIIVIIGSVFAFLMLIIGIIACLS